MNEKQLQDAFDRWLRERRVPFYRSRMDRATTGTLGWPDFTIVLAGRVLLIETKTETGKLSPRQRQLADEFMKSGTNVFVCRTLDECEQVAMRFLLNTATGEARVASPADGRLFETTWGGKRVELREKPDGSCEMVRVIQ